MNTVEPLNVPPGPPEPLFAKGDILVEGDVYSIIARVGSPTDIHDNMVSLVCLSDGSPWSMPVEVKNCQAITSDEFRQMCGGFPPHEFTRVTVPIVIRPEGVVK